MNESKILYLPFSPQIPWSFKQKIVEPIVSREIWEKVLKDKKAKIIVPGYLLEVLVCIMAVRILKEKQVNVNNFITPSYYEDLLKFFNINVICSKNDSVLKEYKRMLEPVLSYPVPIFSNSNNELFFNLLNNYGNNVKNLKGKPGKRSDKPFWKQILQNTCNVYNPIFPKFNIQDLNIPNNKFFKKNYISGKYLLLDNACIFGVTADNRAVKNKIFFPTEVDDLANRLMKERIKCVVLSNSNMQYMSSNIIKLDSWININSLDLLSLLVSSECIVSSDPNIYLSSALLGCKKIISLDEPPKGWGFEDVPVNSKDKTWHNPKFYNNQYFCDLAAKDF